MMNAQHFVAAAQMLERVVREDLVKAVIVLNELRQRGLQYGLAVLEVGERSHDLLVDEFQRFLPIIQKVLDQRIHVAWTQKEIEFQFLKGSGYSYRKVCLQPSSVHHLIFAQVSTLINTEKFSLALA